MPQPDERALGDEAGTEAGRVESFAGMTVILGLGNPYMRDDAVGIFVARELKKMKLGRRVVVHESHTLEASLIWQFRDAASLVVVDAAKSGAPPGTVSKFAVAPKRSQTTGIPSLHELQLHDLIDLAGTELISVPVTVVAIEPKDCSAGEGLTEEVKAAIPLAVEEAVKLANQPAGS